MVSVLEVDTDQKEKTVRYWQKLINIGPIENLLRYDVREQLKYLKETLGFEYVRFWQLYSDTMMIQIGERNTPLIYGVTLYVVKVGTNRYSHFPVFT